MLSKVTLQELARFLGAELHGDGTCVIQRVAGLDDANEGDISFLANSKYRHKLATTGASAVIVTAEDTGDLNTDGLIVPNPHLAFARVTDYLYPQKKQPGGIHSRAVVDPDSQIHAEAWVGPNCVIGSGCVIEAHCHIGPGCVIGDNVEIGAHSRLVANITVGDQTRIGAAAMIHPGVVLAADGFGLANDQGKWVKVPQVGRVIIGDDVEIGANSTIDRGAIQDTVLEDGVKLDNLIHIAHNVRIGAHTAIAAGSAIAGSTKVGRHCAIGGAVGIVGHLQIADNVTITAMSYVTQSIDKPGVYSSGMPLEENAKWHRNFVRMKQLDDMAKQLKQLKKTIHSVSIKPTDKT